MPVRRPSRRCAPTSPASSASPRAARCTRPSRCNRGGSFRPTSATSPAPAIWPMPSAPSLKTAAGAAGSCAWRQSAAATAETVLHGPPPSKNQPPPPQHDIWRIVAFSPGVWGSDLDITLKETHRAQTLTDPKNSTPEYSAVASITGFTRGTHVRLSQDGAALDPMWKVVSDVDAGEKNRAGEKRLIWVHEKPELRRHYWVDEKSKVRRYYDDTPLTGFGSSLPILIESVEYTLLVRELGRLIRVYEGLSLIPDHERYGPRRACKAGYYAGCEASCRRFLPHRNRSSSRRCATRLSR